MAQTIKDLRDEIEKKTGKSPEELYQEREKRVRDAIELKVPDRVPVALLMGYFPGRYAGLKNSAAYYDHAAWREANRRTIVDFGPDMYGMSASSSGEALGILSPELFKWPGDGLPPTAIHQFIEGEPLKAEEYDMFLRDPGDYTLRYYLPRVWGAMKPLSKLPPLQSLWGASTLAGQAAVFGDPDVVRAFELLAKAGQESGKARQASAGFDEEMATLGCPSSSQGNAPAPFDVISDHLRGMRGAMIDMFKNPKELLQACELILTRSIATGLAAKRSKFGNPKKVGSALHRGSDGFMSLKQFDTFYWPTLKKLIQATTDAGLVHVPFYEGNWEQRLERLLELPKGKTIARFAMTDMARAKAVLGGHTCIMGAVPHVLLQTASAQEVDEYCQKLIKACGKGGGFILTTHTGITDEAKPENVRAMVESVAKYGRY